MGNVLRLSGRREQWTAKDVRGWTGRRPAIQERDNGAPSVVIAAVRARTRDASREEQVSRFVVEKRLSRRRCPKTARLFAVVVANDGDVGKACGGAPQVAVEPVLGKAVRFQEQDIRLRSNVRPCKSLSELAKAGAGARALRVRQQHQRGSIARSLKSRRRRPDGGCRRTFAGCIVVRP